MVLQFINFMIYFYLLIFILYFKPKLELSAAAILSILANKENFRFVGAA
jgi:hypothetical protein